MSFPWVVVMLLGGLLVWWSLGQLGILGEADGSV